MPKKNDARAAAAYILGFGRFAIARTSLEQVLDSPKEDPLVRGHAAEALAYIGDPRSVDVLVKHLGDSDHGIKYWCIFALGQIGDVKALPALRMVAERVGDEMFEKHSIRAEVQDAIAQVKQASGAASTPCKEA